MTDPAGTPVQAAPTGTAGESGQAAVGECCGWPELGVCADCPDPETVEWGKTHPPKVVQVSRGVSAIMITGSEPLPFIQADPGYDGAELRRISALHVDGDIARMFAAAAMGPVGDRNLPMGGLQVPEVRSAVPGTGAPDSPAASPAPGPDASGARPETLPGWVPPTQHLAALVEASGHTQADAQLIIGNLAQLGWCVARIPDLAEPGGAARCDLPDVRIWRHRKRRTYYREVGRGMLQGSVGIELLDGSELAICTNLQRTWWLQPMPSGTGCRHLSVLGRAELQKSWAGALQDFCRLVVYQGDDLKLWAREEAEFEDGRFEEVASR